jgi:hypothetical protein
MKRVRLYSRIHTKMAVSGSLELSIEEEEHMESDKFIDSNGWLEADNIKSLPPYQRSLKHNHTCETRETDGVSKIS